MKQRTIHIENLSIGYLGKTDVKVVADRINAGINFRHFNLNWGVR